MVPTHKNLSEEHWQKLSIFEQMGNIGSEVSRSIKWHNKDKEKFNGAFARAIDLFDITLSDPRWRGPKLKEIARAKEIFTSLFYGNEYNDSPESLMKYFDQLALVARKK